MKAIFLKKFGVAEEAFELRKVNTPAPSHGQVLIHVEAFGLNFADIVARKGMYAPVKRLPFILGYDVAGTVVKCGPGVDEECLGRRVVALTRFGGYAEYSIAEAKAVVPIGELPVEKGLPLATQYSTAWYAMEELFPFKQGDWVLIHAAAGGVGSALIDLALRKQLHVIATAGSDKKIAFLKSRGVRHAINYRVESYGSRVDELLQGQHLRASFNSIGGKSVKQDLKLIGAGGSVLAFGASSRAASGWSWWANLKIVLDTGFISPIQMILKSKSLLGINMLRLGDEKPEIVTHCMKQVIKLCQNGEINPYTFLTLPVNELAHAHNLIEQRQTMGKVVITWQ